MSEAAQETVVTAAPDGGKTPELPEQTSTTAVEPVVPVEPVVETPEQIEAGKAAKRYSELTKAQKLAEQRALEAENRLNRALEIVERVTPKPAPAEVVVDTPKEPEEPVFETPEQYQRDMAAYTKALVAYNAKIEAENLLKKTEQERQQAEQQAQQQRMRSEFQTRREAAIQEMPDYVEVAEADDLPITPTMATAMAMDAMGTKIAYHLGKNPAEADRISKLPPGMQVFELGVLKAQLMAAKPAVQTSKAPAPIKPLSGGSGSVTKNVNEMTMAEYEAYRASKK